MSQIQSGTEAAPAALVGALGTFNLVDVLDLLARAGHSGELQVVGKGIDQRIWLDKGDLVDGTGANAPVAALFELACIEEGWFYFTTGTAAHEGLDRVPVDSVIRNLGPQVTEWRELVVALPFDDVVHMSSETPAAEVQIRADQWQILSMVGPGKQIREVVDSSSLHPLDTLRTLRELTDAGLLTIEDRHTVAPSSIDSLGGAIAETAPPEPPPVSPPPPPPAPAAAAPTPPPVAEAVPAAPEPVAAVPEPVAAVPEQVVAAPEPVAAVPEPVAAAATEPAVSDGAEYFVTPAPHDEDAGPSPLPPFVPPAPGTSPIPPAPEGWVEHEESAPVRPPPPPPPPPTGAVPDGPTTGPTPLVEERPADVAHNQVMPPPITGDPWSSSISSE